MIYDIDAIEFFIKYSYSFTSSLSTTSQPSSTASQDFFDIKRCPCLQHERYSKKRDRGNRQKRRKNNRMMPKSSMRPTIQPMATKIANGGQKSDIRLSLTRSHSWKRIYWASVARGRPTAPRRQQTPTPRPSGRVVAYKETRKRLKHKIRRNAPSPPPAMSSSKTRAAPHHKLLLRHWQP